MGGLPVLARIRQKNHKIINTLIQDIKRNPFEGLGNPEPLKHQFSVFWSMFIQTEQKI